MAVTVIKYQQRGMTCGSCRAYAVAAVLLNGQMYATTCRRHLDLWTRRAGEAADSQKGAAR